MPNTKKPIFRKDSASKYSMYSQNFKFLKQRGKVETSWDYETFLGRVAPLSTDEIPQISPIFSRIVMRSMLNLSTLFTIKNIYSGMDVSNLDGVISLTNGYMYTKKTDVLDGTSSAWIGSILSSIKNVGKDNKPQSTLKFTEQDLDCCAQDVEIDLKGSGNNQTQSEWEKASSKNDMQFILSEIHIASLGFASAWYEAFFEDRSFNSFLALTRFFSSLMRIYTFPEDIRAGQIDIPNTNSFDQWQDNFRITQSSLEQACKKNILNLDTDIKNILASDLANVPSILKDYLDKNKYDAKNLQASNLAKSFSENAGNLFTLVGNANGILTAKKNEQRYVSTIDLIANQDATMLSNSIFLIGTMLFTDTRSAITEDAKKFLNKYGFLRENTNNDLSHPNDSRKWTAQYNKTLEFLFSPDMKQQIARQEFRQDAIVLLNNLVKNLYTKLTIDCEKYVFNMEKNNQENDELPNALYISRPCAHTQDDRKFLAIGFLKVGKNQVGRKDTDNFNANGFIPFFTDRVYLCVFNEPYQRVWGGSSKNILEENMTLVFRSQRANDLQQYLGTQPKYMESLTPTQLAKFNSLYTDGSRYAYSLKDAERLFESLPKIVTDRYTNIFQLTIDASAILETAKKTQGITPENKRKIEQTQSRLRTDLDETSKSILEIANNYPKAVESYQSSIDTLEFYRKSKQKLTDALESENQNKSKDAKKIKKIQEQLDQVNQKILPLELVISDQFKQISFYYDVLKKLGMTTTDPTKYVEIKTPMLSLSGYSHRKHTLGFLPAAITAVEIAEIALVIAQAIFYLSAAFSIVYATIKTINYFFKSNLDILMEQYTQATKIAKENCELALKYPNDKHLMDLCENSSKLVGDLLPAIKTAAEDQATKETPTDVISKVMKVLGYTASGALVLWTLGKIYNDSKKKKGELEIQREEMLMLQNRNALAAQEIESEAEDVEDMEDVEDIEENEILHQNPKKHKTRKKQKN